MKVDHSSLCEYTLVPDVFINVYLGNADGDHVRVYLFLLNKGASGDDVSPELIASELHMSTEKVLEALDTWQKEGLFELKYVQGKISAVKFLNPSSAAAAKEKHQLAPGRFKHLKSNDDAAGQLIYVAEEFFGRGLTPSEAKTLLYFYDNTGFSPELCDYLIEYCAAMTDNRSRDFSGYMNKVAVSWHAAGIKTVAQAKADSPIKPKGSTPAGEKKPSKKPGFADFQSHDYDFDALSKIAKQI